MSITVTTTGTVNPVLINDLGRLRLNHPYTGDLLVIFDLEDLVNSADLQNALTTGSITITDGQGQNVYDLNGLVETLETFVYSFNLNATNVASQLLNGIAGIRSDRAPYIYETQFEIISYRITSLKLLTSAITFYVDSCDQTFDPSIAGNWFRVATINFNANTRYAIGTLNIILANNSWLRAGVLSGATNATRPDYPNFDLILKDFG